MGHDMGLPTEPTNETFNSPMRILATDELKQLAKLITFLDKLSSLDVTCEVHDIDGIKLGKIHQHADWGHCFFAEQGGEIEQTEKTPST